MHGILKVLPLTFVMIAGPQIITAARPRNRRNGWERCILTSTAVGFHLARDDSPWFSASPSS